MGSWDTWDDVHTQLEGGVMLEAISITEPQADLGKEEPVQETCTVKWFDLKRGYGFATRGEGTEDIFIHAKVMRACGFLDLVRDTKLLVHTARRSRGLVATKISPCEV